LWKAFLTIFSACVIQHSRLMAIYLKIVVEDIPDNLLVLDEPLPGKMTFYLTKVVEEIPDHLLVSVSRHSKLMMFFT
jgi:hypothetical protein